MSSMLGWAEDLVNQMVVFRNAAQARWLLHNTSHPVVEMRDSCLSCVRKHLAQALVLMEEAKLGHPENRWIAVGHLAEASAESASDYPGLAALIRRHRVRYMDDPDYRVPILDLIAEADKLDKKS